MIECDILKKMYTVFLFLLWIILNGRITLEIIIFGVVLSVCLRVFFKRIIPADSDGEYKITKNPFKIISYGLYCVGQIILANLKTLSFLISPTKEIRPVIVFFEVDLKTKLAKTILANSITITPGTITVSVRDNVFCVHAFDKSMAEGLEENGFLKRLRKMEVKA